MNGYDKAAYSMRAVMATVSWNIPGQADRLPKTRWSSDLSSEPRRNVIFWRNPPAAVISEACTSSLEVERDLDCGCDCDCSPGMVLQRTVQMARGSEVVEQKQGFEICSA